MQSETRRRLKRVVAQMRRAGRLLDGQRLEPVERDEVIASLDDVLEEARRQRQRAEARR